ncbi:energy-coupling factor transport system ATP-binding protein [Sediminihabitans luteus]|uniref:Energy-coupling factor transport system ATP-binding protein n=1 Tax=Sediminihabitans luteus TaxID=1138585 RepID=A0A2M9CQG4_9CELL|nr:ABC transporter ATP-binding protein [Sediminihabitans luteus]PJJ74071.1 energy-coupling factor transport system ATP-binding protein [Sediminihabitans luteus]GII98014.1 cobalt ABC transporter ATP-binding protein [Sediminihabitans luteus]
MNGPDRGLGAVSLEGVSVEYVEGVPVLRDVDLDLADGTFALVVGRTGAGKSTLLRTLDGLVPRASGGVLRGAVRVGGVDVATTPTRDLAPVVGYVAQNPARTFVTRTVEAELAFGLEHQGMDAPTMRRRVEETLDLLGLDAVRDRALETLSSGQQQRVAIGTVVASGPRVLVLDEPTSALDPVGAEEVLGTLHRLVHDLGLTVVVAEHRVERIASLVDVVVHVRDDGRVRALPPAGLRGTPFAPPVVRLADRLGWDDAPLSVRDARRALAAAEADAVPVPVTPAPATPTPVTPTPATPTPATAGSPAVLRARRLTVRYGAFVALDAVDLDLHAGEVTVLMGRNGSGKSTLLWSLQGARRRERGTVDVAGQDPAALKPRAARGVVGLVPQDVDLLLPRESVGAELAASDRDVGAPDGSAPTGEILDRLAPGVDRDTHPRDLSEGQRLALGLAVQLAPAPPVLLLDEPTRGLDAPAKAELVDLLRDLARDGRAVAVATHDVELAATLADRVVVLAHGEVVVDGPARDVLTSNPAFAPQVSRVRPDWLRLDDVPGAP